MFRSQLTTRILALCVASSAIVSCGDDKFLIWGKSKRSSSGAAAPAVSTTTKTATGTNVSEDSLRALNTSDTSTQTTTGNNVATTATNTSSGVNTTSTVTTGTTSTGTGIIIEPEYGSKNPGQYPGQHPGQYPGQYPGKGDDGNGGKGVDVIDNFFATPTCNGKPTGTIGWINGSNTKSVPVATCTTSGNTISAITVDSYKICFVSEAGDLDYCSAEAVANGKWKLTSSTYTAKGKGAPNGYGTCKFTCVK